MAKPLCLRALYPESGWPAHQTFFIKIVKEVPITSAHDPFTHDPNRDYEMGLDLSPIDQPYTKSRFYKRDGKYDIFRTQTHSDGMFRLIFVFKATLPEGKWRCRVWEGDGVEQVLGDIDIISTDGDMGMHEIEKRDNFQISFQRQLAGETEYFHDELHDDGTRYFPDFRFVPQGATSSKL